MYNRNLLGKMILDHWQANNPQMVRELQQSSQLEQAIHETQ